eukprot:6212426-Pleurochrysis_carterae.AAC.1
MDVTNHARPATQLASLRWPVRSRPCCGRLVPSARGRLVHRVCVGAVLVLGGQRDRHEQIEQRQQLGVAAQQRLAVGALVGARVHQVEERAVVPLPRACQGHRRAARRVEQEDVASCAQVERGGVHRERRRRGARALGATVRVRAAAAHVGRQPFASARELRHDEALAEQRAGDVRRKQAAEAEEAQREGDEGDGAEADAGGGGERAQQTVAF